MGPHAEHHRAVPGVVVRVQAAAARHRVGRGDVLPLPRPQMLLTLFLAGTVLAISPIGQQVDLLFHLRPVRAADEPLYTLLAEGLDRIASQRVAGVGLGLVALWLAWRRRTLVPLLVAGLAECLFLLTGVFKIVLAKNATRVGEPLWWDMGFLEHGKYSMAFPSGHATESVLLLGAVVVLLRTHAPGWSTPTDRRAVATWVVLVAQTSLVSWLLGRHWISDLAAGIVFGAFCLALLVRTVESGYLHAADETVRQACITALRRARRGLLGALPPIPRP